MAVSVMTIVESVLQDSAFAVSTPRISIAKDCAAILLSRKDEELVLKFTQDLQGKLTSIVTSSFTKLTGKHAIKRQKMWTAFYKFRSQELPSVWKKLILDLKMEEKFFDPWIAQVIARLSMEAIIKAKQSVAVSSHDAQHLDADEHNALRYAAGYVIRSIKKKYHRKSSTISEWFSSQVDTKSVGAASYQEFTKLWIKKVNRGGLYLVNDSLYQVFLAMELFLRQHLKTSSRGIDKALVIHSLQEDDEVQFYWTMFAVELEEDISQNILKEIVQLWVTIRGFSYSSALVEQYKRSNGSLKRKKAHRKKLKQKSSENM